MALAAPAPPTGHVHALADWLRRLRAQVGGGPRTLPPLPLYVVSRKDVLAGRLTDGAHLVAWRSLVQDQDGGLHALDLVPPADAGAAWRLGSLTSGALPAAWHANLRRTAEHARDGDEVRMLQVSSPPFSAHWLHGGDRDALVPAQGHPAGLEAGALYTPADVVAVLGPEARRAEADQGPETN